MLLSDDEPYFKGGDVSTFKTGSQSIGKTVNGNYSQASTYLDYIQNKKGKRPEEQRQLFDTADEKMKRIHDIIWQISGTNVPVLITGEVGVGKRMVAKAIHEASDYATELECNFVEINCNSMTTLQLERELFGCEVIDSDGNQVRQLGKFEVANKGTVVLNEITETDLSFQLKLFRVLQDQLIPAVGAKAPIALNARVIATTSKDIIKAVSQGKFRQDLYYRLYVLHFEIPPLRERPKDIVLLATKYIEELSKQINKPNLTLSEATLSKLKRHNWLGNIDELYEVLSKAAQSNANDFDSDAIVIEGEEMTPSLDWVSSLPIGQALHVVETHFILKTLAYHKGNRTHAAKTLGISLRTLRNKINEFTAAGFEVPAPVLGKITS